MLIAAFKGAKLEVIDNKYDLNPYICCVLYKASSNLDILLSITTNNFDYVANFSSKENADNAPQGIRKGQVIIGHPSRFEEWVMYQTYYYDANHQYGWQLAFNMNGNGIAYRYRRNSTWNDWAYLVLES